MPVSVLDIALAKGAKRDADGSITMGEFDRLDLPFFGGCQECAASIAAYNAYPSRTGYLQCADHIDGIGFETVADFDAFIAAESEEGAR